MSQSMGYYPRGFGSYRSLKVFISSAPTVCWITVYSLTPSGLGDGRVIERATQYRQSPEPDPT